MMNTVKPTAPAEQGYVLLPDNRKLAWSQWGPRSGRAVLFCTGAGMTGSLGFAEGDLETLGVRLLGIDRPGLGRSSPHPESTLKTWASDVGWLIGRLDLPDPMAIGFSQGAPFALQLGAVGAIKAVAVVAGQDDFGFDGVRQQLAPPVVAMIGHLRSDRLGFESMIRASANADWLWTMIMSMSSEADRGIYGQEPFASAYRDCLNDGFSQGAQGYARDLVNTWSAWPFKLEELCLPVDLWYGKKDASPVHSPDFGATMFARLPNARHFVKEEQGSAILWTCSRRILTELLTR